MNAITAVSQVITHGLQRFGALEAVEVPTPLWERAMDEVTAAGGTVGFDSCEVDGVTVRAAPDDRPAFHVPGRPGRQLLDEGG